MIRNSYALLQQFRDYALSLDTVNEGDDAVIELILDAVSRYVESPKGAGRHFYPRVATRYYDATSDPQLWFGDADLLEVVSLANGEGTTIVAADYNLLPLNAYPKYALKLKAHTNLYWKPDADNDIEGVIDLAAIWGYHEWYSTRAWKAITTVVEVANLNATDTTFTLASTFNLERAGGQIIRIENELLHVRYTSGSADVTVLERGGNGSTAATHANGSTVYLWQYLADIVEAVLEIANGIYHRRTGENATATSVITSGGVVITPKDVPDYAAAVIRGYARIM